ncbi:GGDEF domain-containing protein [Vibrio cortegadensis]|nr:GGDEF domain-containing protein [Vibrio cortegadensis]MDN3697229.1 GGDEF domain-containing protein [Vibrio cortegadensis]
MSDIKMKKLSSYIIILYTILTLVPMLVIGGFGVTKTLISEQNEQRNLYEKVLSQQLINAQKSLSRFDLPLAELVVNDLSRLDYITSVRLESEIYAMTLAEVVNDTTQATDLIEFSYPVYGVKGNSLGSLVIYKDNDAFSNAIYYSMLPKVVLFILLVASISYLFSRQILATLKKPFSDVQNFTLLVANGEFETPPPKHNRFVEIDALFSSLETMRIRLLGSMKQLRRSEERYSRTYNLTQVCLFVINVKTGKIVRANRKFMQIFGSIKAINNADDGMLLAQFIRLLMLRENNNGFEYSLTIANSTKYFQVNHSERIQDEIECSALDISELIEAKQLAELQLKTDALTGVPNRVSFNAFVEQVEDGFHDSFTLMMLDLNGFKAINDTYGHLAGDALLKTIALRLAADVASLGSVYRLGGDEFIVCLTKLHSEERLQEIANSLVKSIEGVIHHKGHLLSLSASVGISHYHASNGVAISDILHDADVAMYYAKTHKLPPVFAHDLAISSAQKA